MQEISLNILDIAQNSVSAKASLIEIEALEDTRAHLLTVRVIDNGCGMTQEQVQNVTDPFYTTRTTRRVGLGVPFLKMAAEMTGGTFQLQSQLGKGTTVEAVFHTDHIDCMPLGDIEQTMFSLVILNPQIDFLYTRRVDEEEFVMDTRQFREILGDTPFNEPEVAAFIQNFLLENSPNNMRE